MPLDSPARRRVLCLLGLAPLLLAVGACGGGSDRAAENAAETAASTTPPAGNAAAPNAATPNAAAPGGGTAQAATGKTWDVKMIGDEKGYRFEPAALTIKAGDAVRWTVASGPPHNVSFWADSVPLGAAAQLGANMPETSAPLVGPLRNAPNETYTVSFAGVPAGTYKYYCTPHLALGMKAALTVQ